MPPSEPGLSRLQLDFSLLVTAPEGVDAALAGRGDPAGHGLGRWLRSDRGIGPLARLEVYASAFFARIHAALREDFPALQAALGEAAFHDLVKLYLAAHPPHTFSLRLVGADLPGFLAGEIAALFRRLCPHGADLAALEWAITDVFDAEDAPELGRHALAAVAPDRWETLRFELAPAHRLLELAWPVHRSREAHDAARPLPALVPEATRVLVLRQAERVFYRELSALEAAALRRLGEGVDLGTVCAGIAADTDQPAAPIAVRLLERWLADGLLSGLRPADQEPG